MPDMGMTDMLPKFVAICFSSGAVTPNPALVAHTLPSWPQMAAWDTILQDSVWLVSISGGDSQYLGSKELIINIALPTHLVVLVLEAGGGD